jgi:hypothetical protein
MRIPFPKRIPLTPLLIVLTAILLVQLIQGTDPAFAVLMLVAQVAAVVGFNRLGGMTHMAGAFCLFAVLPNVTVPEITHALLGQPGDYNLQHPLETAGVCAVFFVCIMVVALFVSWISHPVALLDHIHFSIVELQIISALSTLLAISISIKVISLSAPLEDGTLLAALNHFAPPLFAIGVMLATYVRIVTTNGASAVNWYVVFILGLSTIPGFLIAGKEGMLTPLLCWFFVVASSRHRFTWFGAVGAAVVVLAAWIFVYPFSQNARVVVRESQTISDKVDLIIEYFLDPSLFPDTVSNFDESSEFGTAGSKVKIVNRFSVLMSNDMLIDGDQKSGYTSIEQYAPILLAVVPHALWPDRPVSISSNELGHKAGFRMGDSDTETGITIGSPSMFFDLGGWLALIVYTLILFTVFFFATLRLVGSSERSIWSLVPIGTVAPVAGASSPSFMFTLLVMFFGMFFVMIVILKTISYVAEALISKPTLAARLARR